MPRSACIAPMYVPESSPSAAIARGSLVALCLLLLVGCSSVAFVYNRLDSLAPYYIGTYVSLTSEQSTRLAGELGELRGWHCGTQLPAYAELLRAVGTEVETGRLTLARLEAYYERLHVAWRELAEEASPRAAELMVTLTPAQVEQLFRRLEKDNAMFREKHVERPRAQIEAEQAQQMERHLRRWLGRLTPAQRELVAAWSRELAPTGAERLVARLAWQAELRRLLAAPRAEEAAFRHGVYRLLVHPERFWPDGYRERRAHNRARTLALFASLAQTLTAEQSRHFVAYTRSWAHDFERLTCPVQLAGSPEAGVRSEAP